jgi:pimeloyl-ACP methyl ester carboxylesterase
MSEPWPEPSRRGFQDEYPFASHRLDLDGVGYHYVDEGRGPVVLMVHGNPTWSFAWRGCIRGLASDHRVIAVDHVGCGFSDKPSQYPYRLDQHANNLLTLIDRLALEQITLVGHDWGGAIGMTAATRRPEQFARFVMANTAAFRMRRLPMRIAACRVPLLGALCVRGLNLFSRAALKMAVAHPQRLSDAARSGYLAPYDSWAHRVAVHRFIQDIPLRAGHPSYQTLVETEQGLAQFQDHPLLLAWGEQDWCFTLEFLAEFKRRFPEARTLQFPHAGHLLFEDVPDELLEGIRAFLADYPLASG